MSCLPDAAPRRTGPAAGPADWIWIPCRTDSGPANMDLDRRLFESVRDGLSPSFLRFYGWSSPTLSYGRTQGISETGKAEAAAQGLTVVRRPTGGGKVPHDKDFCFSLAWKKSETNLPWTINESYRAIHAWVQDSLSELGIRTELIGRKTDLGNGWCFESAVCSDLILDGRKVVGGAQWREGHTALHQGSIQLPLSPAQLEVFKANFSRTFGVRLSDAAAPPIG